MADSLKEFILQANTGHRSAPLNPENYWFVAGHGYLFLSPRQCHEALDLLKKAREKDGECIRSPQCGATTVIGDSELCRKHLNRLLWNDLDSAIADI
jgi:hypothetical protein